MPGVMALHRPISASMPLEWEVYSDKVEANFPLYLHFANESCN